MVMSASIEQVKADALSLSERERAALAHALLQSLEPMTDPDAESHWETEIAARAQQVRDGTAKGQPAEEVFAELRARFKN